MEENHIIVHSPLSGVVSNLSDLKDPAFANGLLGEGLAIIPEEHYILAPDNGTVISLFETKHAFVFEMECGIRLFLHVGMDSMRLHGRGFKALVKTGQHVVAGERLLELNLKYLKKNLDYIETPLVLTSLDDHQKIRLLVEPDQYITAGDELIEIICEAPEKEDEEESDAQNV